jgi:hypothetical protein
MLAISVRVRPCSERCSGLVRGALDEDLVALAAEHHVRVQRTLQLARGPSPMDGRVAVDRDVDPGRNRDRLLSDA